MEIMEGWNIEKSLYMGMEIVEKDYIVKSEYMKRDI
jgi:hypothetical protein